MASENNYRLNPDYVTISGTEIGYRAYMPDGQLIPALTQVIVNDTWNEHTTVQLTMYCNIATDKMKFNTEDTPMKFAYREREEILKKRIEELTIHYEPRAFSNKDFRKKNNLPRILKAFGFTIGQLLLLILVCFTFQVIGLGFNDPDLPTETAKHCISTLSLLAIWAWFEIWYDKFKA